MTYLCDEGSFILLLTQTLRCYFIHLLHLLHPPVLHLLINKVLQRHLLIIDLVLHLHLKHKYTDVENSKVHSSQIYPHACVILNPYDTKNTMFTFLFSTE